MQTKQHYREEKPNRRFLQAHLKWRYFTAFFTALKIIYYWAFRNYPHFPKKSVFALLGVVFYLVFPFDLIPDFFFVVGWLDDMLLASIVPFLLKKDINQFTNWLAARHDDGDFD